MIRKSNTKTEALLSLDVIISDYEDLLHNLHLDGRYFGKAYQKAKKSAEFWILDHFSKDEIEDFQQNIRDTIMVLDYEEYEDYQIVLSNTIAILQAYRERVDRSFADENSKGLDIQKQDFPTNGFKHELNLILQTLKQAHRTLAHLEVQAAIHTSSSIPAHLKIDLEDKRKEVAELEERLEKLVNS